MSLAGRLALLLLAWLMLTGTPARAQRETVLVPEVSQSLIEVRQGFTGARLLLYGAVIDPEAAGSAGDYDIVVVLKGPTEPIRIREKDRIAGMWMILRLERIPFRAFVLRGCLLAAHRPDRRCAHRGDLRTGHRLHPAFPLGPDRA